MNATAIMRRIEKENKDRERTEMFDTLNEGNFRMLITESHSSLSPNDGSSSDMQKIVLVRGWRVVETLFEYKEQSGHTTQNKMWGIDGSYYKENTGEYFDPNKETYQVSYYNGTANANRNEALSILSAKGWVELTLDSSDWDAKYKIAQSEDTIIELEIETLVESILNLTE